MKWTTGIRASLLGATLLGVGACASVDAKPSIARAEMSIQNAEKAKAEEHAALEMRVAREKFEAAKAAQARGDDEQALHEAAEASVEASLAAAKARQARSATVMKEFAASVAAMEEEIRNGAR